MKIIFIGQRLPDGSEYHAEDICAKVLWRSSSEQQELKLREVIKFTAPENYFKL